MGGSTVLVFISIAEVALRTRLNEETAQVREGRDIL